MVSQLLKTLTFVAQPKNDNRPLLNKRERLIARLEDQKKLLGDPSFTRRITKWERKDGDRTVVEKQLRVSPWWQLDDSGGYLLSVKAGSKRIEFEKGKAGIVVPSLDRLPAVIDTLIRAVSAGELDEQLKQSSRIGKPLGGRKAA